MTFLKYVNFPVIFSGIAYIPPATPINYMPWVLICFLFNYVIRRRHMLWWMKYNCDYLFFSPENSQTGVSDHLVRFLQMYCLLDWTQAMPSVAL
jgi:hypothetical protein